MIAKISKDSNSVADYLRQIRSLAGTGSPIDDTKLIVKVLSGLAPDYKEISAAIRARVSPISFEEIYDKLTDYEIFLKHEEAKKPTVPITVQVVQTSSTHNSGSTSNRCWHNQSR